MGEVGSSLNVTKHERSGEDNINIGRAAPRRRINENKSS